MARLRLRTQLLIATLLIICALLGALLLIVRHTVRAEIAEGVRQSTAASLQAFENVQQDRDLQLSRTAAMLAQMPTLKAMMATEHALTIQDASEPLWKLAGSQLFILSGVDGRFFAFHVSKPGWESSLAERDLKRSIEQGDDAAWWYGNGQLYRVFLRTILAGSDANERRLGILAVGYQIDSTVAQQLALASGGQIALATGGEIIASTLSPSEQHVFQSQIRQEPDAASESREIVLGDEPFQVDTVLIHQGPPASVKCYVLMSLPAGERFPQSPESENSDFGSFGVRAGGIAAHVRVADHHASAGRFGLGRKSAGPRRLCVFDTAERQQRSGGTGRRVFQNAR